jgi:O-antigen biosynthesis protein
LSIINMHREFDTKPGVDFPGSAAAAARLGVDGRFLSRGGRRFHLRGVAYGPFSPNSDGNPFPEMDVAAGDFADMKAIGLNASRVYHLPPPKLLDLAHQHDHGMLVDVPWSKHLCFLHSARACRDARAAVRDATLACRNSPAVLALSIGNEIPSDVVRWHGANRVERFLRELADVVKQADADRLVTYANYPPTEYLDLSHLDFATFNVYLHDIETFRRYLLRLMNLVGDKPLVLGEIGMDTLRHGEGPQSQFLAGHIRETAAVGLAGSFVFSWTDEWFTGKHSIVDWAFGVTRADRTPKTSYHAIRDAYADEPIDLVKQRPRVSVIVCCYNGGTTLASCLESLSSLDYPDYEVVLVDDGSTDDTRSIAARFPGVRTIHQENQGLSAARNAGLTAATGSLIAYTDADCMADPDWLTFLAAQFERTGAAAVGGPNLAPYAGRMAACVAAAPGQPMHVLESDQVAEHIPGCNMAFRREALLAINGFDTQFRKAGDDVDICWRLQAAGYWISFAPAATVWHHRRQTPRAYLRQQAGYGEAEALLRFKHPDRFNFRGQGKWSGMLYGASLQGLVLDQAIVYHGTFGTGPFQCIYQPGPAHWAMVPSTLEWHMAAAAVALLGLFWWPLFAVVGGMLATSVFVAAMQAMQARLPRRHESKQSRLLIAGLCYVQPLVRAWARYRRRYFAFQTPAAPSLEKPARLVRRFAASHMAAYWGGGSPDRTELIERLIGYLDSHRCGKTIDTGWSDTDLYVFRDVWSAVSISTVQEEHGGGNRVIRVRCRLKASTLAKISVLLGAALVSLAVCVSGPVAAAWSIGIGLLFAVAWSRGARLLATLGEVVDVLASDMKLVRVRPESEMHPAGKHTARSAGDRHPQSKVETVIDMPARIERGPRADASPPAGISLESRL